MEMYLPVINDLTFWILLTVKMVKKLKAILLDVETAFLYGELKETIFMECPEGMEHKIDECLKLNKSIYGLTQASKCFYNKIIEVLQKFGFKVSAADPCLLTRQLNEGVVYLALYVDDILAIGDDKALQKTIQQLQGCFSIKQNDKLTDYLSCDIRFSDDGTSAWIGQPHLIKRLETSFGNWVRGNVKYRTPGTPGYG